MSKIDLATFEGWREAHAATFVRESERRLWRDTLRDDSLYSVAPAEFRPYFERHAARLARKTSNPLHQELQRAALHWSRGLGRAWGGGQAFRFHPFLALVACTWPEDHRAGKTTFRLKPGKTVRADPNCPLSLEELETLLDGIYQDESGSFRSVNLLGGFGRRAKRDDPFADPYAWESVRRLRRLPDGEQSATAWALRNYLPLTLDQIRQVSVFNGAFRDRSHLCQRVDTVQMRLAGLTRALTRQTCRRRPGLIK